MLPLAFVTFGMALRIASDGTHRVAIQRTPTTLEIRDDVRHTRELLGLAPNCVLGPVSRGGVVLLFCQHEYQTIDLTTGARDVYAQPVTPDPAVADVSYSAAGRYWLERDTDGYHYADVDYVQRFTGEVRRADGVHIYGDVDSAGLVKPLCRPVHRSGYPMPHAGAGWQPADSDGRVAVVERFVSDVWRCGAARPLASIRRQYVTAGGGWATWSGGALRLRDGRRYRLPRGDVVHTRRAVYVLRDGRLRRAAL